MPWRKEWLTSEHKQSSCSKVTQKKTIIYVSQIEKSTAELQHNRVGMLCRYPQHYQIPCLRRWDALQSDHWPRYKKWIAKTITNNLRVHAFLNASVTEPTNTLNKKLSCTDQTQSDHWKRRVPQWNSHTIHTNIHIYTAIVFFLCVVNLVLCFCEPSSNIARIYIYKPIVTSPKAQDPERRDLIAHG